MFFRRLAKNLELFVHLQRNFSSIKTRPGIESFENRRDLELGFGMLKIYFKF